MDLVQPSVLSSEETENALLPKIDSIPDEPLPDDPTAHRWSSLVCYIAPLMLLMLVNSAIDSSLMVLAPLYTESEFIAGSVITCIDIGMLTASPFMGSCIDRTSAEFLVITSSLVRTAALVALSFLSHSTVSWLGFAIVYGWTVSAASICVNVFMSRWIPAANRGRSSALINGGRRIGNCIGPLIAGHLGTFDRSMSVTIAISMMSSVVVCCLMTPPNIKIRDRHSLVADGSWTYLKHAKAQTIGCKMCNIWNWFIPRHHSEQKRFGMCFVWTHYAMLLLKMGIFTAGLKWVRITRKLLITFRAQDIGLTKKEIGSVNSISFVPESVLFPLAGYVMDKCGRRGSAIPGLALFVVALSLVAWTETFEELIGIGVLFGIADGITTGLTSTMIADLAPTECRAEFLSQYQFFSTMAAVLNPVVIGILCSKISLKSAAISSASVGGFALFWITCIMEEPQHHRQRELLKAQLPLLVQDEAVGADQQSNRHSLESLPGNISVAKMAEMRGLPL